MNKYGISVARRLADFEHIGADIRNNENNNTIRADDNAPVVINTIWADDHAPVDGPLSSCWCDIRVIRVCATSVCPTSESGRHGYTARVANKWRMLGRVTARIARQAPPPARPAPPGHTTAPPVRATWRDCRNTDYIMWCWLVHLSFLVILWIFRSRPSRYRSQITHMSLVPSNKCQTLFNCLNWSRNMSHKITLPCTFIHTDIKSALIT